MNRPVQNQRLRFAVLSLIVLAACTDPSAPPNAVLGTFGGVRAVLVANRANVRINLGWGQIQTDGPRVPDPAGGFGLAAQPSVHSGNRTVTVRGVIDGPHIAFDVITIATQQTITSQYSVTRDQPGDF